jgi:hypothetical protein
MSWPSDFAAICEQQVFEALSLKRIHKISSACMGASVSSYISARNPGLRLTECHGSEGIDSCSFIRVGVAYTAQSFDTSEVKGGGRILKQQQCLHRQEVLYSSDYVKSVDICELRLICSLCQGCRYHSDGNRFPALGALEYGA